VPRLAVVSGTGEPGGVGFRDGAAPLAVVVTDAPLRDSDAGSVPPSCAEPAGGSDVVEAFVERGARLLGVGLDSDPMGQFETLAVGTSSYADLYDDGSSDDPVVTEVDASRVKDAVVDGIQRLTGPGVYDLTITASDPTGLGLVESVTPSGVPGARLGVEVGFDFGLAADLPSSGSDRVYRVGVILWGDEGVILGERTLILLVRGT